jgi:hypothetical protein
MNDTQNQIKYALKVTEGIDTLDHSKLTKEQIQAFRDIDIFAHEWLAHQQQLIDSQAKEIEELRYALQTIADGNWSMTKDKSNLEVWATNRINALKIAKEALGGESISAPDGT